MRSRSSFCCHRPIPWLRCDRQANSNQPNGDGKPTPDHATIHNQIPTNASKIFSERPLAALPAACCREVRWRDQWAFFTPLTFLRLQRVAEIVDRRFDSLLKSDARLPTEHLFCAGDIRLAYLRVIDRQWFVFDCRFCSGDPNNFLGELLDRHLSRITEVHRLVKTAHGQFENPINQI